MSYFKEIVEKLKEPIPYQWRVQSTNKDKTRAQCTAYIDARQVMDRLDEVCEYGWSSSFEEVAGGVFCRITIFGPDRDFCSRADAGNRVEEKSTDQMYDQGYKATASDAFKRAAVQWGVGRFLYDMDHVWLPCNQYGRVLNERGEEVRDLTEYVNNRKAKPATQSAPPKKEAPKKEATPTPAPTVTPTPAPTDLPPQDPAPKKKLDQKTLDAMVKAINAGEGAKVKDAMDKYDMTLQQRTILNALLK